MNYIGIDIGGTNVKMALVDANGKILKRSSIKTHGARLPQEVVADIVSEIKNLSKGVEYTAIGVGCPGAVDSKHGVVEYSPNLQWRNVNLEQLLNEATGKYVKIANDASCAALGETKFGAGKHYTDTALITLGTGVGGGFVVDGKLFEGYKSMGAEIGHTVIVVDGEQCSCGRKGCFEAYASATALIREARRAMQNDTDKVSKMWDFCGFDRKAKSYDVSKIDGRAVFWASKQGDAIAKDVDDRYVKHLAEGVVNVVNLFRSQAVILGGGVCAEETLAPRVQDYVDKYRYGGKVSLSTKVVIATLGNDAGVVGAASLVIP